MLIYRSKYNFLNLKRIIDRLVYHDDADLINSLSRKSQDFFILQAIVGSIFMVLTGGVVLSGFAVYLGASDETVGYIPLISSISGIFLVFSGLFLERFKNIKKLVICLNSIAKPLLVSIILVPLLIPEKLKVLVLFIILIIGYSINMLMSLAINSWFVNVIPLNIRGRYFAIRQVFAVIISALVPLISGIILDITGKSYKGFAILYATALVFIIAENIAFWNIEDSYIENSDREKFNIADVFRMPLKNKEFMGFTYKMIFFYMVLYISASFSQVYMIRYLRLSYTFISTMSTINALIQIFILPWWGKICDQRGNEFALRISIWFFAGDIAMWALVSRSSMFVFIPMAYIFGAFSNSGFAVANFNRKYSVIPEKCRTFYDGFYTTAIGLTLLIAPFIGGRIKSFLAGASFVQGNIDFGEFRILYALSVLGIVSLQVFDLLKDRKGKGKFNGINQTS
ncbi:MAG: MFS transporter [Firmicutes bacterium]|nr:MFS transporter [Bacillota bacterium]